jgi:hypothetical protein
MMLIVLAIFLPAPSLSSYQEEKENAVKVAIIEDDMTTMDMRKWYSVFKGACLWGREFDFMGARDNEVIFARLQAVRNKIAPSKGTSESNKAVQVILDEYKEVEWDTNKKNELIDDLFYISEGFRLALNEKEE